MSTSTSESHITSEELGAYIDGRLDQTRSARLESHMADCADCRADLIDVRALLATAPQASSRSRRRAWLVAAGIIAIVSVPPALLLVPSRADSPAIRATQTTRATIEIVSPLQSPIDLASVVFVWRPVADATTYRLTVTDSSGAPVFTRVAAETTLTFAGASELHRGTSYLWYVDGITSNGLTVTSGIRSFATSK
jgi:hypothetical protein